MLNNNGPRYKRSKLERQMNVDVFWCVVILLVMCLFAAVGAYTRSTAGQNKKHTRISLLLPFSQFTDFNFCVAILNVFAVVTEGDLLRF